MPHLALNVTVPDRLRARYNFLLGLAPLSLVFAWSLVLLIPEDRFNAAFRLVARTILRRDPTRDQESFLLISLIVVAMLTGYALGWLVNEMIARFVLQWSPEKVRAVFSRSEVPPHWLRRDAMPSLGAPSGGPGASDSQRAKRLARTFLLWGIPGWGLPMFFVMELLPAWGSPRPLAWPEILHRLAIWCLAGAAWGAVMAAVVWFGAGRGRRSRPH